MRCNRLLGHKWSKWYKKVGAAKKDGTDRWVRPIVQARRCASCGYMEEVWTNSVSIIKEAPDKKED